MGCLQELRLFTDELDFCGYSFFNGVNTFDCSQLIEYVML